LAGKQVGTSQIFPSPNETQLQIYQGFNSSENLLFSQKITSFLAKYSFDTVFIKVDTFSARYSETKSPSTYIVEKKSVKFV